MPPPGFIHYQDRNGKFDAKRTLKRLNRDPDRYSPWGPHEALDTITGERIFHGGYWTPHPQVYVGTATGPGAAQPAGAPDPRANAKHTFPNTLSIAHQNALLAANASALQNTFPGGMTVVGGAHGLGQGNLFQQHAQMLQQYQGVVAQGNVFYASGYEPPAPIEDTGVKLGEVLGWRTWRVEHGWLYSRVMDNFEWEPGKDVEAHAIGPNLGDGIHAFKTRKQAIEYAVGSSAVGQVALWGQIYEFEKGWHGEFARVHSITDAFPTGDAAGNALLALPGSPFYPKFSGFRFWSRRQRQAPSLLDQLRQTYGVTEPPATAS